MDLSVIDKINENASRYPEVAEAKRILSENGVDFENRTVDVKKLKAYAEAPKRAYNSATAEERSQFSSNATERAPAYMADKQAIVTKVFIALILIPQREPNGEINYLFGKGIGTEIALLGNCPGREDSGVEFEPRTHSDFEFYDVKTEAIFTKYPALREVFGGQEFRIENSTKALNDIPKGYLDETHQVVDFYGIEVLVPCLEVLYVDKMLYKENTPRPEGYDAKLLAKKYKLDPELCKKIYIDYHGKAEKEYLVSKIVPFDTTLERINKYVKEAIETDRSLIDRLNYYIIYHPKSNGFPGVNYGAIPLIEDGDIANKQVTPAYIEKLEKTHSAYVEKVLDPLKNEYQEVVGTVEQINENTTTWTAE